MLCGNVWMGQLFVQAIYLIMCIAAFLSFSFFFVCVAVRMTECVCFVFVLIKIYLHENTALPTLRLSVSIGLPSIDILLAVGVSILNPIGLGTGVDGRQCVGAKRTCLLLRH